MYKKTVSVILALALIFMAGCTPVKKGETTKPQEDKTSKLTKKGELSLLYGKDMIKIDLRNAKEPLEIFLKQLNKDFTYREETQFQTAAPVKPEIAIQTLKVGEESKEVQVEFNRILAPNDYLIAIQSLGNYGSRTRGYIKHTDKGVQEYSQSVMMDEKLVQEGQAQPEFISEEIYEDGVYKLNALGPKRDAIELEDEDHLEGYEGEGRPRFEVYTLGLFNTLGVEKVLKIAKDSGYLVSVHQTEDETQYQYTLNNSNLIPFMEKIADELTKEDNKMFKLYSDNLAKLGLSMKNKALSVIPYDYEYTVENLLQMYMNVDKPNKENNPFKELAKKSKGMEDNRYTSFSMILGKQGEIKGNTFVEGKELMVRHTQLTKHYGDVITYNITRTYIPFEISPDKETLLPNYKAAKEVEQRNEMSQYISDKALVTTSKALIFLQLNLDTEVVRGDIEKVVAKIGNEKLNGLDRTKPVENYDMYADIQEGMYLGLDDKASKERENKMDPVSYWVNKALWYSNSIQDKLDIPNTVEVGKYKFRTSAYNEYVINNIVSEETIEMMSNPPEQENTIQITELNDELKEAVEKGLIEDLVLGTPKAEIMNKHFGKDIYNSEMNNGKVIGDYVKDKSKPTMVFFGEHWCGFCKATMKFLNNLDEFWDKYNLVVITDGVSEDFENDPEKENYSNIIPNIQFEEGDAMAYFNIASYPTLLITTLEGKLIHVDNAILDYSGYENFDKKVDKLLEGMAN